MYNRPQRLMGAGNTNTAGLCEAGLGRGEGGKRQEGRLRKGLGRWREGGMSWSTAVL